MNDDLKGKLLRTFDTEDFAEVVEGLLYGKRKPVFTGKPDRHRWWADVWTVVKLADDFYVSFWGAMTTGDDSPREKGWKFDPESIREVEPYEEVVTLTKFRDKETR